MTTNFKRFDPNLANIQSDGNYLIDTKRTNGAAAGIFTKEVFNKALYQATNLAAALADAMVAKGYTVEDGSAGTPTHDYTALVAVLAKIMLKTDKIDLAALADNATTADMADDSLLLGGETKAQMRAGASITGVVPNAATANRLSDGTNLIRTKIINIGSWNMDATSSKGTAHGLTFSKIRSATALIRNDGDTVRFDLSWSDSTILSGFGGINIDAVNIYLYRHTNGVFDNPNFDTMGDDGNRGWIVITYVD